MKNKLFLLCFCTALPGCSSYFDEQYDLSSETNKMTNVIAADDAKTRPYQKYNEAFLGKRVEYSAKKQQLLTKNINIESYEPIDLQTLLNTVSVQTGISYRINADIPGKETVAINDNWQQGRSVSFDGTFEEFMRYVSSLYDVNPVIDNNNVLVISVYETYAIKLDFYGQNNKFEAALDLSGNEATSDGGLTAKSEYKFESTFWDDVKDMADKYVSTGVYNIFKDASILTFTGRPSEHKTLSQVLKKYQDDNNRQFIVTYKIFVLDKKKVKEVGAGLDLSYINGGTNISVTTPLLSSLAGGISPSRNFYAPDSGRTLNINGQLDALYELTGSRVLQSGSFVTRNNVPIPLNMTRKQNYVSGRTRTINDTTNREDIEIETGEIITGTSFIITPRVLSDGRIEVSSGFTKRFLNGIDNFDNVQLPTVTTTETFNISTVTPGTLLMVSKYEAEEMSDGQRAMIFGAGAENSLANATVVMVVGIDYHQAPHTSK